MIAIGVDLAYTGPLGVVLGRQTVEIVGGSPCAAVDGRLVAWYENWMRA